jgi:hypothetical protein
MHTSDASLLPHFPRLLECPLLIRVALSCSTSLYHVHTWEPDINHTTHNHGEWECGTASVHCWCFSFEWPRVVTNPPVLSSHSCAGVVKMCWHSEEYHQWTNDPSVPHCDFRDFFTFTMTPPDGTSGCNKSYYIGITHTNNPSADTLRYPSTRDHTWEKIVLFCTLPSKCWGEVM